MALFYLLPLLLSLGFEAAHAQDPCTVISGKTWAAASDVRACYKSLPFNATIRNNIVEVVNKTMAFHTSTNYQVQAPSPFEDVHEDIIGTLARISGQKYDSDFDLHVDIATSTRRMGDGHSVYVNMCYDLTYVSYVPVPLVLLKDSDGTQNIYVDPQAQKVFTQDYFSGQTEIWQNALGNQITLASLSGAKVVKIDNQDPWKSVDATAATAGSYQSFATRQNSFFAGFVVRDRSFTYLPGLFAQTALPLKDSVTLTVQRVNSSTLDTITLPFRSRIHPNTVPFTDGASFWKNNCLATGSTNIGHGADNQSAPTARFSAQPFRNSTEGRLIVNEIVDVNSAPSIPMPASLVPERNGYQDANDILTWILDDGKTAVMSIGDFNGSEGEISLMVGMWNVVSELGWRDAKRLIIDVSNNQGGLVCAGALLHYLLKGNTTTTSPQALLPTKFRAQPLAQKIVDNLVSAGQTDAWYTPTRWKDANHKPFSASTNYLREGAEKRTINGRADVFSQTIGQECQPFYYFQLPQVPDWTGEIVIVSNGRCASTCALFVTAMAKLENVKVVSVGGKLGTRQQYAGTVGGQSLDFSNINSDIKTAGLKNDPLAPPDFITNSYQGITWRLANGAADKSKPEEWQSREAVENYQLTADIVNDPWKMWNDMSRKLFKD